MASPTRTISAENSDVCAFVRTKNRSSSSSTTGLNPRELPKPKSPLSKNRKQALSDIANSSCAKISGARVYASASGGNNDCLRPAIKNVPSNGSVSSEMLDSQKTIEARSAKAKTCLKVDSVHDRGQAAKVEGLSSEMETMCLYNDYADDYDIWPKEERLSAQVLLNLRGLPRGSYGVQEGDIFSPPPSPPGLENLPTGLAKHSSVMSSPDWKEYLLDAVVPALEDVLEEEDSEVENMFPPVEDEYMDVLPKEEGLTTKDVAILQSLRGCLVCPLRVSPPLTPPAPGHFFHLTPPCYEEFMLDLERLKEEFPEPVPLE